MRFHSAISTGLAAMLVLPVAPFLTGDGDLEALERALRDVARSLDVLTGIQEHTQSGEPAPAGLVAKVTESPFLEARGRDERLQTLRNEVNLLQTELDALESRSISIRADTVAPMAPRATMEGTAPPPADGSAAEEVGTGLDQELRELLEWTGRPPHSERRAPVPVPAPGTDSGSGSDSGSGEPVGYSADPLRHAQASFRAGRFADGLALCRRIANDPHARLWEARCLERLGRLDEAIDILSQAVDQLPAGHIEKRARGDLEFYLWKRDFLSKLPPKKGSKP
ncbi:MAG: CDC27 family protein [Planctomycetota bacterium]|nr:CDC27 family protein [Planctomycetota bacterium]